MSRGMESTRLPVPPQRGCGVGCVRKGHNKPLDKPHKVWYNECVKRRGCADTKGANGKQKLPQKKCKKPLDKLNHLWYN